MAYQEGKPQPLSHHIASFRKGIAEDMLGGVFIFLIIISIFLIYLLPLNYKRNKTECLQARDYELTTDLLLDILVSHLFFSILSVKQGWTICLLEFH